MVGYARYSTELQNEKSIEDQVELCRTLAARLGLIVVGSHFDRAKSGASTFGRPRLARIMQQAEAGSFDVLIAEAPDRIFREPGVTLWLPGQLRAAGTSRERPFASLGLGLGLLHWKVPVSPVLFGFRTEYSRPTKVEKAFNFNDLRAQTSAQAEHEPDI